MLRKLVVPPSLAMAGPAHAQRRTLEGAGADGKPMKMTGSGADALTRQADGNWLCAIDNPVGVAPAQR